MKTRWSMLVAVIAVLGVANFAVADDADPRFNIVDEAAPPDVQPVPDSCCCPSTCCDSCCHTRCYYYSHCGPRHGRHCGYRGRRHCHTYHVCYRPCCYTTSCCTPTCCAPCSSCCTSCCDGCGAGSAGGEVHVDPPVDVVPPDAGDGTSGAGGTLQ